MAAGLAILRHAVATVAAVVTGTAQSCCDGATWARRTTTPANVLHAKLPIGRRAHLKLIAPSGLVYSPHFIFPEASRALEDQVPSTSLAHHNSPFSVASRKSPVLAIINAYPHYTLPSKSLAPVAPPPATFGGSSTEAGLVFTVHRYIPVIPHTVGG